MAVYKTVSEVSYTFGSENLSLLIHPEDPINCRSFLAYVCAVNVAVERPNFFPGIAMASSSSWVMPSSDFDVRFIIKNIYTFLKILEALRAKKGKIFVYYDGNSLV